MNGLADDVTDGLVDDVLPAHTLVVEGELTIHTAGERKAALVALLEAGHDLDIVLSGVTELDTAGLQLLLMAHREAMAAGRRVRLVDPSRAVLDVLAIAHLSPDLEAVR
jgi:anti-anti-sigma factor